MALRSYLSDRHHTANNAPISHSPPTRAGHTSPREYPSSTGSGEADQRCSTPYSVSRKAIRTWIFKCLGVATVTSPEWAPNGRINRLSHPRPVLPPKPPYSPNFGLRGTWSSSGISSRALLKSVPCRASLAIAPSRLLSSAAGFAAARSLSRRRPCSKATLLRCSDR